MRPSDAAAALTDDARAVRVMARSIGALYTCGALLAFAWLALPHAGRAGDRVVSALAAATLGLGVLMLLGATDRLPYRAFHVILALIQVVISVGYAATGDPSSEMAMFYAWATPCAAFFFSARAAFLYTLWVACLMAGALVAMGAPANHHGGGAWLMTVGTVVAVGMVVGSTARKIRAGERQLRHAALHDPLTGLPNRTLFAAQAQAALRRRETTGGAVLVLLLDLDRFKLVNDTYGHATGDELLAALAPRLLAAVEPGDTVARLGGDEFAVVCRRPEAVDPPDIVRRLQQAWADPISLRHGDVYTTGSIGVAIARLGSDTATGLLRDADAAMYAAKDAGPGGFAVFDEGLRQQAETRMRIESSLPGAQERGELSLRYQPVVDLATGRTTSAEVLLRWTSPELGMVSPGDFIPVAEDTGIIVPIGAWVLAEAAAQAVAWRAAGDVAPDFRVAVNVSACQICPEFPEIVAGVLAAAGAPADAVILEITETVLLDDSPAVDAALRRIVEMGVQLHLDDFGTGYAALSYLHRFPLSGLKVDRSFIAMLHDPRQASIVSAILRMARSLGLTVVAEGVERAEQLHALRLMACDHVQGWHLGVPVPAAQFPALLAAGTPGAEAPVPRQRVVPRGTRRGSSA